MMMQSYLELEHVILLLQVPDHVVHLIRTYTALHTLPAQKLKHACSFPGKEFTKRRVAN
jgi:hypothetical protein